MTTSSADCRVAVVIPVYCPTFLGEALHSVFTQSRQPDEVIVVDDGAPDQDQLSAAIGKYGERVTLIRQPNRGAAAARNTGLASTTADLVALLDADDLWLPSFLEEQLAVLAATPDLDLVYCDGVITGNTPLAGETFMDKCPSNGPVTLESLLAQRCTVLLSGVVARRQAILDANGFDPQLRRGHDFDLWLRMAQRGARLTYQRKVLLVRRVHDDNLSGTSVTEAERPLSILERTLSTLPLSDRERAVAEDRVRELRGVVAREYGKEFLRVGQYADARRELSRAQRERSTWKLRAALLALRVAPQFARTMYLTRMRLTRARQVAT